ncbi:hypothetical protein D3C79_1044710 [compost metagenome]
MVIRLHMAAQAVEGFVVILLFQMRQFMYHDHAQERLRRQLEYRRHADFCLGLQLATLYA